MTPTLAVRLAGEADAVAIGKVGAQSFTAAYGDSTQPEDLRAHVSAHFTPDKIRRAIALSDGCYLVAVGHGEVVAFARLGGVADVGDVPASPSLEVRQLYVAPQAQRMGAGRLLLREALEVARELGAGALWLSAWEQADWALAFYRSAGFRKFGSADFRVGATLYRDVLLWLPVSG